MYVFLNPETGRLASYDDFRTASLQAAFVGQKFLVSFGDTDEDEPIVYEFDSFVTKGAMLDET